MNTVNIKSYAYTVDQQSIQKDDLDRFQLKLEKDDKEVFVTSLSPEVFKVGIKSFLPDEQGGCSIYRPVCLMDGTMATALVRGSVALMVELGWLAPDSLGSFEELIFENYALTGEFPVKGCENRIWVRFSRKEDLSSLRGVVTKLEDWEDSWPKVTLDTGVTFNGQPKISLEQAVELDLLVVDKIKFSKIAEALSAVEKAIEDYHRVAQELGAIVCSEGSYEDYHDWYEIQGVPGTWPCPD